MLSSAVSNLIPSKSPEIHKRSIFSSRPHELLRPDSGIRTSFRATLTPSASGLRQFNETRNFNSRNRMRRTDRMQGIGMKYNMTPEEVAIYEDFAKILSNYEPDEMCGILSDVLKDAKGLMYK